MRCESQLLPPHAAFRGHWSTSPPSPRARGMCGELASALGIPVVTRCVWACLGTKKVRCTHRHRAECGERQRVTGERDEVEGRRDSHDSTCGAGPASSALSCLTFERVPSVRRAIPLSSLLGPNPVFKSKEQRGQTPNPSIRNDRDTTSNTDYRLRARRPLDDRRCERFLHFGGWIRCVLRDCYVL